MIQIAQILAQLRDELNEYLELLPSVYNPVVISLFVMIIILAIILTSYRHIYQPLLRKHKKVKNEFEVNTAKMLTLFSELDPNPIIRVDKNGNIIGINKTGKARFGDILNTGIGTSFPDLVFNITELIEKEKSHTIELHRDKRFYEVSINGISFLEMAQLYFWDTTVKMEYEEQMKHYHQLLRNSSTYLQKVIEDERNRISGILHDSVAQNLLLIRSNANRYKQFFQSGLDEQEYRRTIGLLDTTLKEVKELAHYLRPLSLDELGLITAIKSMCKTVSYETGLKNQSHMFPEVALKTDKQKQLCIFRIVQESLNNIIRHSKAKSFSINLIEEEDSLVLIVADDGIGFTPQVLLNNKYISDGLGLMSMQENVERLNGTFIIDSAINKGTNIVVTFPLHEEKDKDETS